MSEHRLIVGLGNPGKKYQKTRHNLGFLVVDRLAERSRLKIKPSSTCNGLEAKGKISGKECWLLLPLTYMNHSGIVVKRMVEKENMDLSDILIVCDDFNLDLGTLRMRRAGSDGGHNGLSSVIDQLQTSNFARLRVGIGTPLGNKDSADYVLEEFSPKEKKQLEPCIEEAVDCCFSWLRDDMEKVMSQFNKRKENE